MQATQTQAVHAATGIPVVSEAQARANAQRQRDEKVARKAAKDRQARIADEAREQRRREREAVAKTQVEVELGSTETIVTTESTPVTPSKMGVIVSMPTALELDRRAADLLRYKREQAQVAANRIYGWMEGAMPSLEDIERELVSALFVQCEDDPTAWRCEGVVIHSDEVVRVKVQNARDAKRRVLDVLRGTDLTAKLATLDAEGFEFSHEDDRGNHIYSRQSVEVTLFMVGNRDGGAKRFDSRLSPEQQRAANRRAQSKGGVNKEVARLFLEGLATKDAVEEVLTPEKRAERKAKNIRIAAEQKAAKEARQAKFRAGGKKEKTPEQITKELRAKEKAEKNKRK